MAYAQGNDSIEDLDRLLQDGGDGSQEFEDLDVLGDDFDADDLLNAPMFHSSGAGDPIADRTDGEESFGTFDDDKPYEVIPGQPSYNPQPAQPHASLPHQSLRRNDHIQATPMMQVHSQNYSSSIVGSRGAPPSKGSLSMDESGGSYMSYQTMGSNSSRQRQNLSPSSQARSTFSASPSSRGYGTASPRQPQMRQAPMRSVSYQPDLMSMQRAGTPRMEEPMHMQHQQMHLHQQVSMRPRGVPNRSISYTADYGAGGRNTLEQMQMMQPGDTVEMGLSNTVHSDNAMYGMGFMQTMQGNEALATKSDHGGSFFGAGDLANNNISQGMPVSRQFGGYSMGPGQPGGQYAGMTPQTPDQLREAMEKLTQKMQRSAMSRNMVQNMGGRGLSRSNSARQVPIRQHSGRPVPMRQNLGRFGGLQRHNSGRSLDDSNGREIPIRRTTDSKHRVQHPQRGVYRQNSQQRLGDPQGSMYRQNSQHGLGDQQQDMYGQSPEHSAELSSFDFGP